jgi:hypothetical protein
LSDFRPSPREGLPLFMPDSNPSLSQLPREAPGPIISANRHSMIDFIAAEGRWLEEEEPAGHGGEFYDSLDLDELDPEEYESGYDADPEI